MSKNSSVKGQVIKAVIGGGLGVAIGMVTLGGLPGIVQILLTGFFGLGGFIVGANLPTGGTKALEEPQSLIRMSETAQKNHEQQLREVLALIQKQRSAMETLVFRITDDELRSLGDGILRGYQAFAQAVQQDSKDVRPVRRFLGYYGEVGVQILERYQQLAHLPEKNRSSEVAESLGRVKSSLTELQGAFEQQLQRLLDNDLMELDTELTVLEKTIALEGLKKPEPESDLSGD